MDNDEDRHAIAAEAVAAERERCAKIVEAQLREWNIGGEFYANVTDACVKIAAKIREGRR